MVRILRTALLGLALCALVELVLTDRACAGSGIVGCGDQVFDSRWSEGAVEILAGGHHTLARRSDGSVVAWGQNFYGECDVPAFPPQATIVPSLRSASECERLAEISTYTRPAGSSGTLH